MLQLRGILTGRSLFQLVKVAPGRGRDRSISYVKLGKHVTISSLLVTIATNVPFCRCPSLALGMTRIAGRRVYMRARRWRLAEWARTAHPQPDVSHPWEPNWPDDSLGRDHFRRRLRQQVREWRAEPRPTACSSSSTIAGAWVGGINLRTFAAVSPRPLRRLLDGPAPCRAQGLMTDALRRAAALRIRRAALHRLEAACLPHNDPSKAVLARSASTRRG